MKTHRRTFIASLLGAIGIASVAKTKAAKPGPPLVTTRHRYKINPEWDRAGLERVAVTRPEDKEGFIAIIFRGDNYTPPKGFLVFKTGDRFMLKDGEIRPVPMFVRAQI